MRKQRFASLGPPIALVGTRPMFHPYFAPAHAAAGWTSNATVGGQSCFSDATIHDIARQWRRLKSTPPARSPANGRAGGNRRRVDGLTDVFSARRGGTAQPCRLAALPLSRKRSAAKGCRGRLAAAASLQDRSDEGYSAA